MIDVSNRITIQKSEEMPRASHRFHLFLSIVVGSSMFLIGIGVGFMLFSTKSSLSLHAAAVLPTIVNKQSTIGPSPQVITHTLTATLPVSRSQIMWKTYLNTKYGYQVNFPTNQNYEEQDTANYGYTNFLEGCFNVYVVPQNSTLPKNSELTNQQINDLGNIPVGSTKTYATPNWGGQDGFTYKIEYKKIPPKTISGLNWSSFEIMNNFENDTLHNMYFTKRNNDLYLIDMQSSGPCYEDEPIQMLNSFTFTT